MKARVLRQRKSQSFLWVSYFLAFFTVLSLALIFVSFLINGVLTLANSAEISVELPQVLLVTLKIFGVAYIWVVPWAAFLTVLCWRYEGKFLENLVTKLINIYLRTPSIVVGIFVIYIFYNFSVASSISFVVGFLALPRLVSGWLFILKSTPTSLREAGTAAGMPFVYMFYRLYLFQFWPAFVEHLLKVTAVLAGAVAPFVYLTSFSFLAQKPLSFLSLEAFREMVKGNDGSPFVWASMTVLTLFIVLLTLFEEQKGVEGKYYG